MHGSMDPPVQRRSPRFWSHVEWPEHVLPGDVLTFQGIDAHWREGTVHSRARDVDSDAAWWVMLHQWSGNAVHLAALLVERSSSGVLRERAHDGLVPPRALSGLSHQLA